MGQLSSIPGVNGGSSIWEAAGRLGWFYPYMAAAAVGAAGKSSQKRKGGQIRFTNEQTDALEQQFDMAKYLSPQERKKLAKSLTLSERQVRLALCFCS